MLCVTTVAAAMAVEQRGRGLADVGNDYGEKCFQRGNHPEASQRRKRVVTSEAPTTKPSPKTHQKPRLP